jgi:tetraacyldisaccharide 4'-kinase
MDFNDHHTYTRQDILAIEQKFRHYRADVVITTEKDYVKLMQTQFADLVGQLPFYYLPIEVRFLFGQEADFCKNLWKAISHEKN